MLPGTCDARVVAIAVTLTAPTCLYLTTDPRQVKLVVIDSILRAYTGNEAIIQRKNRVFTRAFGLTAAGTGLLGLGLMTQITCETVAPAWSIARRWVEIFGSSGC